MFELGVMRRGKRYGRLRRSSVIVYQTSQRWVECIHLKSINSRVSAAGARYCGAHVSRELPCHRDTARVKAPGGCCGHGDWGWAASLEAVASIGPLGKADWGVLTFFPAVYARGGLPPLASHRSSWKTIVRAVSVCVRYHIRTFVAENSK